MPILILPGGGPTMGPQTLIGANMGTSEMNAYLGRYRIHGSTIWVPWYTVEPTKGTWTWTNLDSALADATTGIFASRGATPHVHLACNSSWGAPGTVPGGASMPPGNVADYQNFIAVVCNRYAGHGIHWAIENEPQYKSPGAYWNGTRAEYLAMLSAAYTAFQGIGDSTAVMLPGGISSPTLILSVAKAICDLGGAGYDWADEAFSNHKAMFSTPMFWGDYPFDSEANFLLWCADALPPPYSPGGQGPTIVGWLDAEIAANTFDREHIHWHHKPEKLREALNYVQARIAAGPAPTKNFEVWELGWDWDTPSTFSTTQQARGVTRLIGTAVGQKSLSTLYSRWTTGVEASTGITGLVGHNTGAFRPGAHTYCYLANRLHNIAPTGCSNVYSTANTIGYQYNSGEFQIWWRTTSGSATINLTTLASPPAWVADGDCRVTNLRTFRTYHCNPAALGVGADPILVEAMPEDMAQTMLTERVMGTQPAHLAAFWPMAEEERATFRAYDQTAHNYYGRYYDCHIGEQGPGDGLPGVRFDGEDSYLDVWGPGLAGVFDGDAGTLAVWARGGHDPWEDEESTDVATLVDLYADDSNRVRLYAMGGSVYAERTAQGLAVSVSAEIDGTRWHQYVAVWDPLVAGTLALYVDGNLAGTVATTTAWAESLTAAVLGKSAAADADYWAGRVARAALWHTALTNLEVDGLYPAKWPTWEVH